MKTIKKIQLQIEPSQKVTVPFNSAILKLDVIDGVPYIWVLCPDDASRTMERGFVMVDTEVPQRANESTYVGTFHHKGKDLGMRVLHVFEDT